MTVETGAEGMLTGDDQAHGDGRQKLHISSGKGRP